MLVHRIHVVVQDSGAWIKTPVPFEGSGVMKGIQVVKRRGSVGRGGSDVARQCEQSWAVQAGKVCSSASDQRPTRRPKPETAQSTGQAANRPARSAPRHISNRRFTRSPVSERQALQHHPDPARHRATNISPQPEQPTPCPDSCKPKHLPMTFAMPQFVPSWTTARPFVASRRHADIRRVDRIASDWQLPVRTGTWTEEHPRS